MVITSHSADLTTEIAVDFHCPSCGVRGRAIVASEGVGITHTITGIDVEAARAGALQEAQANAKHQAKVTLRLVRCPRCKHRSTAARVAFAIPALVGTVVLAAVALGFIFGIGGWLGVGLGALFALSTVGFAAQRLARLAHANRFVRRWELLGPAIPTATAVKVALPAPRDDDDHAAPRLLR